MPDLNVFHFGPADGPPVLALHGLTGHGKRWQPLAEGNLAEARVIAPDLRGHGRSTWAPPWNFETIVADLVALLEAEGTGPVVVVGHSFGGAVGVHLAASHPQLVKALVLLDPAIALPPAELLTVATSTVEYPDYTDVEEARSDKLSGAWGEVPEELLDTEIHEHLSTTRNGRVGWRMGIPAITGYWSELAREFVLPPPGLRVALVQAMKVQPAYVTDAFKAALRTQLGDNFTLHEFDCDHMVPLSRPRETAEIVRPLL
ncbi:alpha/beta hydrolase [Antrihabitans sp. YC2-6]|uniref:alpha/beta hydrolase n=1 Tax=Antrihabitans sp. YC2-6 TaxID=2799498 RepID=UPI0027DD4BF8|nr:alpha/beta hydrolase [Antrihabitans sp. YC2-6]